MVTKKTVTLINVDSLLGYAIASRFLESEMDMHVRLVCNQKDKEEAKELERLGAQVIQVDYDDEKKIEKALKDTWLLLIVPEYAKDRLEYGNLILSKAKHMNVNYVVLFSFIGIDYLDTEKNKHYQNLAQYKALEEKLGKIYDEDSYCVIRLGFFNQLFYHLSPMLEDKNQIRLPVREDSKWCTIDLGDATDAVYNLCFTDIYATVNGNRKNKTLFELTPDHPITGKDLVEAANEGLNKNMTYDVVKEKELSMYLRKMHTDNRFKRRPSSLGHLELQLKKDRSYTFPLGKYLSDANIETLLEWWHLADNGDADVISDDLQKALNCPPQSVKQFFKQNSEQFRLLR